MMGIRIRKPVVRADWRSELAAQNGIWLIYWDLNDSDEQVIRVAMIDHQKDERRIRKGQAVSVRPIKRPRIQAPIAMIIGTIEIPEKDRHIWAPVDGMPPERMGSFLRHSSWWSILADDAGVPVTVFNPARWRATLAAEALAAENFAKA
jgi:hypothetical protein